MQPAAILSRLLDAAPMQLSAAPRGPGIYALYDHAGDARYVGITAKCLRDRIFNRHVGGDDNSHKFSSAYNAGRMFHSRRHSGTCAKDGPVAKKLRRLFVREHCRAVTISLQNVPRDELFALEAEVIALAPAGALSWNNLRRLRAHEPEEALDAFIDKLGWSPQNIAALERQRVRWQAYKTAEAPNRTAECGPAADWQLSSAEHEITDMGAIASPGRHAPILAVRQWRPNGRS